MTKYAHESSLFVENGRFLIKYGYESIYFFLKLEKRNHPMDFLGPYSVILTELTFFDKMWS